MQIFLKWAAASTVVLAACGGNVVVDGPATGTGNQTGYGGTTSTGYGGYGGYYDTSVTGYGGYGGYGDTGGGYPTGFGGGYPDGGACTTCAEWLTSGGDDLCNGLAAGAQENILSCACGSSSCATACGYNVCQFEPISAPCEQCLQSLCAADLSDCENN